jgi:cyclic beta-1,2-glucan synthetase
MNVNMHGTVIFFMIFIGATYAILAGLIVYLLVALHSQRSRDSVEVKDTVLTDEELEKHAAEIARNHPVGRSKSLNWLVRRLNDNYSLISGVYGMLSKDAAGSFPTAPAAEWLLDNFYIIEEQVRIIKRSLSRGRYAKLPVLTKGYLKGYPRVYAIALEIAAHSNGSLDEKNITAFLNSYQSQVMLSMGELWAIPLMLRIALIESIRNTCEGISSSRREWQRAEALAAQLDTEEADEHKIDNALRSRLEKEAITPAFTEHLIRGLRKQGKALSAVTALLDLRLEQEGTSTAEMTASEHQYQAEMQVAIGNAITGLRLISELDWSELFETLSRVEHILRGDPKGIYPLMDFESRDHYRHEIEKISRTLGVPEIYVADKAVECAKIGAQEGKSPRDHVGFYLIGKGRKILLDRIGKSAGRKWRLSFALSPKPKGLYAGIVLFIFFFLTAYFMYYTGMHDGGKSVLWPVIAALLVAVPASELALNLTNTLAGYIFSPSMLPKLEYRSGIPEEAAAFVIVPALLTSPAKARELVSQMEVCYLANREANLFFALVGDFRDAASGKLDGDDEITRTAVEEVGRLNAKYPTEGAALFYYLHRSRTYNSSQDRWMGWERKRGAIVEFNRLLRGGRDTGFDIVTPDLSALPRIKYVITLDADTCLPMGNAKKLIGTMAHPLNMAVVDENTGIVKEGYGILQPRIGISIPDANKSFFTKVFAGHGGIDPYTTAVSDVYQDIYEEGIFTGKGIYDVDIFLQVLEDRIPDNTVLSHDLLEGCHLRAGLVSDIELVDGYPGSYRSFMARQHRWTRGDWQLLPWLGRYVRRRSGEKVKNNLSGLSRWKIFDNLRRSLLYPSLLLLFLAGILFLPGDELVWIGFAVLVCISPLTMGFFNSLLAGTIHFKADGSDSAVITGLRAAVYQSSFLFMFIPYQAYLMFDAVIRTLYRVLHSHRNMLEWVTAADAEAGADNSLAGYYRRMWFSVAAAAVVLFSGVFVSNRAMVPAIATAAAWAGAPLAAYLISMPAVRKQSKLSDKDIAFLKRISRKTWRYFEDYTTQNDNYLPPDNFQQDPPKGTAHRTSPTNIGFMLLSVLSAHDLGYIGPDSMAERLEKTIGTMEKLEKWKGHLYNWYDTITLEKLRPLYVSAVDSGNLVGYMMVLRQGLKEYRTNKLIRPQFASGLADTMELMLGSDISGTGRKLHRQLSEIAASDGIQDIRQWESVLKSTAAWLETLPEGVLYSNDGWGLKLAEMTRQFTGELYSYYPFLDRPADIGMLQRHDAELAQKLYIPVSPDELLSLCKKAAEMLENVSAEEGGEALLTFRRAADHVSDMIGRYEELTARITVLIDATEFSPLFDKKRMLFSIGYDVEDGHLSKSYYDLLASEARQTSFIAIARGEADRRHWMRLGRKLTGSESGKGLVSWTGTMFEYLMPLIIMRSYENTILGETYSFVVKKQRKYCRHRGIPWGISESGYSALDFGLNYQYKAFGVPELGLKRGLAGDMVTAPYASLLAVGIDPASVTENLRELKRLGMEGLYGFYEAVDFTPSRMDSESSYRIVKSFMAHHQGMSLAALNNFFNGNILQKRFHSDPVIRSADLLLQEKMPARVVYSKGHREEWVSRNRRIEHTESTAVRTYGIPGTIPPNVHLLSNGEYSVLITDGGSGRSLCANTAVNRWEPDYVNKNGFYIFIQNINSNTAWSATYDPFGDEPEKYRVVFSPDKAEFTRRNGNIESYLEITVSPEDNAEIRRISITNHSGHVRYVELTSFFEVVDAPPQEDASHPAFSKLFIRTEFIREHMCLLAARRQRKAGQRTSWLVHTMSLEEGDAIGELQYETDRMRFIGRNRDISDPEAMEPDQPLSGSTGSVLDPVMSLRRRIKVEPGQTVRAVFTVAVADSRDHAVELADKYNDFRAADRAFELSWTRSRVENRYLGLKSEDMIFYLELVPFFLYGNSFKRYFSEHIMKNTGSQQDLWSFGISGDLPLMLVEVNEPADAEMVEWALKGHEYWRMKNLTVDLAVLVNKAEGYEQPINEKVRNAVAASHARDMTNRSGGVFIINRNDIDEKQISLLYTAASLVVRDSIQAFRKAVKSAVYVYEAGPRAKAYNDEQRQYRTTLHNKSENERLLFFNGIGGFSEDGREYVINLENGRTTPLPWSNIIANRSFGFLVTESGGGYTWCQNSREFKLTPWVNDPVTDRQGEIFYISDTEEGCHWSLTPMPVPGSGPYSVRHGPGSSIFSHESGGIAHTLTMFVPLDQPVKICIVRLKNLTDRQRKLKITWYIRPVLGVDESRSSRYIATRMDKSGIIFIENRFTHEFRGKTAFMAVSAGEVSYTCDRTAFIGPGGNPAEPAGLSADRLSGEKGAGLDPCAAVSCIAETAPEGETAVVFLLGCTDGVQQARDIVKRFSDVGSAVNELERVRSYWKERLDIIRLHTPDDSFDVLMNGWLVYQATVCRMWARTGYYQAGGAYGFRDQLQDCMALLNTNPELSRDQILLHASRQFRQGDVQHWWHAEKGKGIRTRYSDDLLWLAYVTAEYLEKTGDASILEERIKFLEGNLLEDGEDERYEEPQLSDTDASLYEHCVLAIDRSLGTGPHGIPLIGSGDWNDGMNTVGNRGSGESVWLGWFLITILYKFIPVCRMMNDPERSEMYRKKAAELTENIEREAWDGSWYRRAYFDDGTPLGSVNNSECMIDSISQSWSVISGAAKPERAREAMAVVQKYLVDTAEGIVRLLTPPFDEGELEPGYIKGYVPGVRENGGQYTHAATWVVLAFTRLGMGDKACEIFHMLNPINHTRTDFEYSRYKTEPYVMAADVYAVSPNAGRGGWTWYTGAAGWLYKVGLENMAGFVKKGERLYINPCIPSTWRKFEIYYNHGDSVFHIEVRNPDGVSCGVAHVIVDGRISSTGCIDLSVPGRHSVEIVMGSPYHFSPEQEPNAAGSSIGKS